MRISNTRLSFDTIHLEGGLFVPDILERAARGDMPDQTPADYHLPRGLQLTDEYGRAFQIALASWKAFKEHGNAIQFGMEFFRDCLGYFSINSTTPILSGDIYYPLGHLATENVPLLLVESFFNDDSTLDTLNTQFSPEGSGNRRKSPFQMVQEFLNSNKDFLWAIVSNGKNIRLLRDSHTMVRPVWLELDLGIILEEERYSDFKALWLILHSSRASNSTNELSWELWRKEGLEQGTRVREGLRQGVTKALINLGQGFLNTPGEGNKKLIEALESGELSPMGFYQEILRLIYRLLFLYTIEERGFLHPGDPKNPVVESRQKIYRQGYSMARLRDLSLRRSNIDGYQDLWKGLQIVFLALNRGEEILDLPGLGGIFATDQCPHIDVSSLSNSYLLKATKDLRWTINSGTLALVDYKNMGPEEFGSVYESLLELVPIIDLGTKHFGFIGIEGETGNSQGNARKITGSYYTPNSLVQELIKSTLDPVIKDRLSQDIDKSPVEKILSITVVDPSCGSGHFLLAAARRLAEKLAQVRSDDGSITPTEYRHSLREVIIHCIYGVDRNPMAVELARMALWLEGFETGKALGFLDHHLQVGDSLLGLLDLSMLEKGIPDQAYKVLSGEDKDFCVSLKKFNKSARSSLESWLKSNNLNIRTESSIQEMSHLESMLDEDTTSVKRKKTAWLEFCEHSTNSLANKAANVFVGAFLMEKKLYQDLPYIPTTATIDHILNDQIQPQDLKAIDLADKLCKDHNVFHWPIRFPQIFNNGGFDVVLGNPPWEKINFKDNEYFATIVPEIAEAPNKAVRKELLNNLKSEQPKFFSDYERAKTFQDRLSIFFRFSGRFPLTGVSRINLYSVFAETGCDMVSDVGHLGMVLQSGIVTDDNNKKLFTALINDGRLINVWDFENSGGIFKGVHKSFKFALVSVQGSLLPNTSADFAFYLTQLSHLEDSERHFTLTGEELNQLNPNTMTCPTFRNKQEAELTKFIYKRVPAWELHNKTTDWPGKPKTPFNMSNDSGLFTSAADLSDKEGDGITYLPLYEAKLIHQYNHRFSTFIPGTKDETRNFSDQELANTDQYIYPRYYLEKELLEKRFPGEWFFAYRMITNATNERTCVSSILPQSPCGHSLSIVSDLSSENSLVLISDSNSFVHDYCCRQKVGGTNFNHWIWHQIPLVSIDEYQKTCEWDESLTRYEWLKLRTLELVYTAWNLKSFTDELGWHNPPFIWDTNRRFLIRCELDAAYFHWYLGSISEWKVNGSLELLNNFPSPRAAVEYILDTFPIVNNRDMKEYGEYKTKNTILKIYDEMDFAICNGEVYKTCLNPEPGDVSLCHKDIND